MARFKVYDDDSDLPVQRPVPGSLEDSWLREGAIGTPVDMKICGRCGAVHDRDGLCSALTVIPDGPTDRKKEK